MRFRWNGRTHVALATWAASACLLAGMAPAQGQDASVRELEARLAASRSHLQQLYAASASAGRQFTAAEQEADAAQRAVQRERALARRSRTELAKQSDAVAVLTVQQLQDQAGVQRWSTLLRSAGPQQMLEKSAAFDSAAEAMTAQIDELSARAAVHAAAQHRFEAAEASRRAALTQLATNRDAINAAIATAQAETKAATAERERLLKELAGRKQTTVADVASEQEQEEVRPSAPDHGRDESDGEHEASTPDEPDAGDSDSDSDSVWDKIAQCESGGNWHINTGNGYYGGLQFSAATWKSVGGPGLPHEHSREVQIHYAKILQKRSGWGQWSCAGARFD